METPARTASATPQTRSPFERATEHTVWLFLAALGLFPIARLLAYVFSAQGGNAANVQLALRDPALLHRLGASVLVALISTAFAALVGYGISRAHFARNGRRAGTSMLMPLFGSAMFLLPLYAGAARLELFPPPLAPAMIYALIALPFCIARLKIAADTITPAMLDAARVDGCSAFDCCRLVVLPSLARALFISAVFCLATEWNLRAVNSLLSANQSQGRLTAALALLLSVPLLALLAFLSRRSAVGQKLVND